MSASKKFNSGCCKNASSIGAVGGGGSSGGGGSGGGGGGGGSNLWELSSGQVTTVANRPVRVANTIFTQVMEIDSDKRLKTDIESINTTCVENLFQNIHPKKFVYKKTPDDIHYGFIAQDIKKAGKGLEHLVSTNDEGLYSVRMLEIIPFLFAKIKQLEERIEHLDSK